MQIFVGNQCSAVRRPLRLSLRSMSALTGISTCRLSAFENGGRLSDEERARVAEALESVQRLCAALAPARIDLGDSAALLDALRRMDANDGEWFAQRRKLEQPAYISF